MKYPQLNDFISALKLVRRPPANLADMGLIIKEKNSNINTGNLKSQLSKDLALQEIIYNDSVSDEDVLKLMVQAFKNNTWVLLEIKKDVGSVLLNQLQHLANSNNLQINDFEGQELFEMSVPENVCLIALVDRDFIESKITYPHFYKLFGPTLNLN